MTIQDALNHGFNKVKCDRKLKHAKSEIGTIAQIKPNGVSVDFGTGWNFWFWAKDSGDKRSKYMSWLTPIKK